MKASGPRWGDVKGGRWNARGRIGWPCGAPVGVRRARIAPKWIAPKTMPTGDGRRFILPTLPPHFDDRNSPLRDAHSADLAPLP